MARDAAASCATFVSRFLFSPLINPRAEQPDLFLGQRANISPVLGRRHVAIRVAGMGDVVD